jgi:hypothetical protein
MFHTGDVPWKLSFVAIAVGSTIYAATLPRHVLRQSRVVFFLFGILIASTLIGGLMFHLRMGTPLGFDTMRVISIYVLACMSFIIGLGNTRQQHRYLLVILVLALALNLIVSAIPQGTAFIADFYNVSSRLQESGYRSGFRIPGIMNNPNITATSASLLLIAITIGFKRGYIVFSTPFAIISIFSASAIVLLMLSRNQFVALSIIIVVALSYIPAKLFLSTLRVLTVTIVITVFALFALGDLQKALLGINVTDGVSSRIGQAITGTRDPAEEHGPVAALATRPLLRFDDAYDRWLISGLFGTGFEVSRESPGPNYHNDWFIIMVSAGFIGFVSFVLLALYLGRINPLLVLPLLLPGLTNSIVLSPQLFVMLFIIAGIGLSTTLNFAERRNSFLAQSS